MLERRRRLTLPRAAPAGPARESAGTAAAVLALALAAAMVTVSLGFLLTVVTLVRGTP